MKKLLSILKNLPIDVGQAERKHFTAGKKIALEFIPSGKGKIAVDVGCRDGFWSEMLKSKGYQVKSLDIEPHYKGALRHDVEKGLPFKDHCIDLVWCTEVIEHLHKPSFLLQEIERVVRKGGVAILTTPNSSWWIYAIVKMLGWSPEYLQNPDHKQFFNLKSLRKLAKGYKVFGYFPYAIFFLKISRFVGFLSPTFIFVKNF